ncbi:hypothetical protein C8F01DRAFT_1255784 [Mycena amicta]|nr:hypothetical protein C8F01DRAFT_1255784 [Mycena amicta]
MALTKSTPAGRRAGLKAMQEKRKAGSREADVNEAEGEAEAEPRATSSHRPSTKRPSPLSLLRIELEETKSSLSTSQDDLTAALSHSEAQRRHIVSLERKVLNLQLQVESLNDELTESNDLVDGLAYELTTPLNELRKTAAQVTRLKRERTIAKNVSQSAQTEIHAHIALQDDSLNVEKARNDSLDAQLARALVDKQELCKKYDEAQRTQPALKKAQNMLKKMQVWNPMDGHIYGAGARCLFRRLDAAGVVSKRMPEVLAVIFQELGIKPKRLPSPRLIRRIVKEGGLVYSLSSDGTTMRSINYESWHVTLPVPDYKNPNAKPIIKTVMLELNHALDHTAKSQFEGDLTAGAEITDAYRHSPIYDAVNLPLDDDDFLRKQNRQNLDHTADGKAKVNLTQEGKRRVIQKDLGRVKFRKMTSLDQFNTTCNIDDATLEEEFGPEFVSKMTVQERERARTAIVVRQLGEEAFNALPEDEQCRIADILFAGCMCHKDLNIFGYAVDFLEKMWPKNDGPVLLANKANDSAIRLADDPNSAAVKNTIKLSSRGAIKLIELAAMTFRNKNEITGYLQKFNDFMERRKREVYPQEVKAGLIDPYAATELFLFLDLYIELVETVINSKVKSAQANHVESNLLKGFRCIQTQTELAAVTMYATCVSWPYMRYARGGDSEHGGLINLLDTVEFHRNLGSFCQKFTDNPSLLLNPTTDDSQLTVDREPFMNPLVVAKIRSRASELPDLERALAATFRGAIKGWDIFTEEFKLGGSIDQLTTEERDEMFIDSTNDADEGGLGTLRQQKRKSPAGTIALFSARMMYQRNGTEDFISAHASSREMLLYAARETRKLDASGAEKKFRSDCADRLITTAAARKSQCARTLQKQAERRAVLLATPVIVDIPRLNRMTVPQLTAQMKIHWQIFQDPVLMAIKNKSVLSRKTDMLTAVKAAVKRYLIR